MNETGTQESEPRERVSILETVRGVFPRWRVMLRVGALVFAALYLASGLYVVQPDEQGVVTRFGRIVNDGAMPGMHYRLPWPVEKVDRPKITEVKIMSVGFRVVDRVRGLPPAKEESEILTGDENIINIQLMVQYRIADPAKFLFAAEDPHWLVRRAAESTLTQVVGSLGVDDILTSEKFAIQERVREGTEEILARYGCGLKVIGVYFQDISPPSEVGYAFRDVSSAREDKNRIVHEAQGYRNEVMPKARGEAEEILRKAEAYRIERVERAKGDADRFVALLAEYEKHPEVTRTRLYVEAMEEILPRLKKYMIGKGDGQPVANLKLFLPEASKSIPAR
ncbi:MAG: FtsH protease activity modulator HflK [Candidatus Eisenbacteria sp.]|nr:FtsH protease activity modulator HflK [Candidatus Eisenbacteria bacterium]